MRGQVLGVDTRTGEGMIAGEDGTRYRFAREDWAVRGDPRVGLAIDFETEGGRALSIFPVPDAAPAMPVPQAAPAPVRADRDKIVAALLAFFLGTLGIHRFYLRRTGTGILMLVLSITVVGLLVTGPWALIDMIRYLVMPEQEFARRYGPR